jgi:hypothetical protein
MELSKKSYLMIDTSLHVPNYPIYSYNNSNQNLIVIPNFLSESELEPFESKINLIRTHINLDLFDEQSVGTFTIISRTEMINKIEKFKYIAHHKGRYDVWNIGFDIKVPIFLEKFTRKSIGALLVNANTFTDGKFHKDTIELFETISNSQLPPFYYTMLIALSDQTIENAPTQFVINEKIYWVPLKRGDAVVFNGELVHRGTANITSTHRDMIYTIFTTSWYDEEKL